MVEKQNSLDIKSVNAIKSFFAIDRKYKENERYLSSNKFIKCFAISDDMFKYFNYSDNSKDSDYIFADGGNSEIATTELILISKLRIATVRIYNKKRESERINNAIVAIKLIKHKISVSFIKGDDFLGFKDLEIDSESLKEETEYVDPKKSTIDQIRRTFEFKAMLSYARENNIKHAIFISDGSIIPTNNMDKKAVNNLITYTKENNCALIGISKSTQMQTTAQRSLAELVNIRSEKNKMFYFGPVAQYTNENEITIGFAKLHPRSDNIFRIDFAGDKDKIKKILEGIAKISMEPTFLGYPYGLIIADRLARVNNEEINFLRTKLESMLDDKEKRIILRRNSHSFLDQMG